MSRKPGKAGEKSVGVLGRKHARDKHERARNSIFDLSERRRHYCGATHIVSPIEPEFRPCGQQADQPAYTQPLHARWPIYAQHADFKSSCRNLKTTHRPKRSDGGTGVFDLMATDQARTRKIKKPLLIGINQAATFFVRRPLLARNEKFYAETAGFTLNHGQRFRFLSRHDRGRAAFQNSYLLSRYESERRSEMLGVIDRNRCKYGRERFIDDIARIEAPAKPCFQ